MMKKIYLFVLTMFLSSALFAQIFVTENGAGVKDGSSWANAYDGTQLQKAIDIAEEGSQIWIAKGIYYPTTIQVEGSTNERDKSFLIKDGISLLGGFAGNENTDFNLNQRDFMINETILSGDLKKNDDIDTKKANHLTLKADNSYHVLLVVTTKGFTLDGFTITGGYADGLGSAKLSVISKEIGRNKGAALYSVGTSEGNFQFKNLIFRDNIALSTKDLVSSKGGAVFFELEKPGLQYELSNVSFIANKAASGGALFITTSNQSATILLNKVTFQKNEAYQGDGGAFYNESSLADIRVINSVFEANSARDSGGAVAMNAGNLSVDSTVFQMNKTLEGHGGAIHFQSKSKKLTINNSRFYRNIGAKLAGALYMSSSTALIDNTIFYANEAQLRKASTGGGGAIYLGNGISPISSLVVSNTIFYKNHTAKQGGAIGFYSSVKYTQLSIVNSIFNRNSAETNDDIKNSNLGVIMFKDNIFSEDFSTIPISKKVNNVFYKNSAVLFQSTDEKSPDFLKRSHERIMKLFNNNR